MVDPALDARKILKNKGIETRIIDMHTIKPVDKKIILKCAKETGAIITAEEHSIIGGLGSAVAETLIDNNISVKFNRMGINDRFCESGDPKDLLEKYGLNKKHMIKNVINLLKN
jgi:transketolase